MAVENIVKSIKKQLPGYLIVIPCSIFRFFSIPTKFSFLFRCILYKFYLHRVYSNSEDGRNRIAYSCVNTTSDI